MGPQADPALPTESRVLRSFDAGEHAQAWVARPDRYAMFDGAMRLPGSPIGRGAGLSYVAASFAPGGCAVAMDRFDRILGFDPATGEVTVEAGITLWALHRFLTRHGRYLAVQPGHGAISIGGCIAADTHGKNQARDGNFHTQVAALCLFHPRHGLCGLDAADEAETFAASCGGFGLTGVIVAARLRTRRLPASHVSLDAIPVNGPAEAAALMRARAMSDDLLYSWHDFSRRGGPGLVFCGRFAEASAPRRPQPGRDAAPRRPGRDGCRSVFIGQVSSV